MTVGCGARLPEGKVCFTINGLYVGSPFAADYTYDFQPHISASRLHVNYGQSPFVFDSANKYVRVLVCDLGVLVRVDGLFYGWAGRRCATAWRLAWPSKPCRSLRLCLWTIRTWTGGRPSTSRLPRWSSSWPA